MRITLVTTATLAALVLSPFAAEALTADETPPAGVKAVQRGDGVLFADPAGMALYTYDGDDPKSGKSACNAVCAQQWPAAIAPADATPQGAWSLIQREDGKRQWAFAGQPLYRYAAEGGVDTTFGDGDGGTWHLAVAPIWTPPGVTISRTVLGSALADAKGMTLYTRTQDGANKSNCAGSCLENFIPVTAAGLALGGGDWSIVARSDSSKQWAYKGKPLYRSLLDVKTGETSGDGIGLDEGWRAALLEAAPSIPSWVTYQQSLGGEVLADPRGFTLYYHGGPRLSLSSSGAGAAAARRACETTTCMGAEWKAVLADEKAKPMGNWTVLANTDGTRQWAHKGIRLWTNTVETQPAELTGLRFGGDRSWKVLSRSLQPIQNM